MWKQALLLIQFTAVTLLISLLVTVARQYDLMLRENPGYNTKNMLHTEALAGRNIQQYETARQELLSLPFVTGIGRDATRSKEGIPETLFRTIRKTISSSRVLT